MPSLVKTFRRCHSTVRGLRKSCAAISGLVQPFAGEPGDVVLLRGQLVAGLDGAAAHLLPGRHSSWRARSANPWMPMDDEHLVGRAELLAGVDAPLLPPQPLAVEEVGASQLRPERGAGEAIDRLRGTRLGGVARRRATH